VILVFLALFAVLGVPLFGGRIERLGELRIRYLWAAPLALGAQIVLTSVAPGGSAALHQAAHIATYVLLLLFLWENRAIAGMGWILAGCFSNALVISCNGGVMPQSVSAHRLAGLPSGPGFHNSALVAHPVLLWLGDVIPVPAPGGLGNTLSVGDCLIFVGLLVLLYRVCRPVTPGLGVRGWAGRASLRRAAS
jgi:hypothetical protein